MKKLLPAIFILIIFSFGCASDPVLQQTSVLDVPSSEEVSGPLEMPSPDVQSPPTQLKASFMSDNKTFAYTISYDGQLLGLVDTPYSGASAMGPSFKVQGGAELTGSTVLLDTFLGAQSKAGESASIGQFDVYEYTETLNGCTLHTGLVPFGTEALRVQTRTCSGQDSDLAQKAFMDTISDLTFKAL